MKIESELNTKESAELKKAVAEELKQNKNEEEIREVEKTYGIQRDR